MSSFIKTILFLIITLLFAQSIRAQRKADSLFKPRFYLYAGAFVPDIKTSIRFDSKTLRVGTEVSLEESLDFESQPKLFRTDGIAKLSKRSTLALTFLAINRSRSFSHERDIEFMDTTFYADRSANLTFNTNYFATSYRYNIFSKPTWSAGLSIGLRVLTIKTILTAESSNFGTYSSSSKLLVPAALIGLHGSGYLTKRFQFRYTWEYLKLNIEGVDIFVFDNNISLEYYIIKNLGLGCSYSNVSFIMKEIPFSDEFSGEIEYTFSGLSLFIAARF